VNDWYQMDYYDFSPPNNPPGPASGIHKVMRGASWGNYWWDLLSAHRFYYNPQSSDYSIGFRCAGSVVE
jgi:formylglycine-generating enzyme required for sulfatase activity